MESFIQGNSRDKPAASLLLEGEAEVLEQSETFLIGVGRGDESDVHAHELRDVVDVDLREDDLLGDAEGVVAAAVELDRKSVV